MELSPELQEIARGLPSSEMRRALPRRHPVHTFYGGAHLFKAETISKLGKLALAALDEYAPDPARLAEALGLPGTEADALLTRIRIKLASEPVEDLRIDFEDGFGDRSPGEEARFAKLAAAECVRGAGLGLLPPFLGIRIKPFSTGCINRSLATLEIFLSEIASNGGGLPHGFVVTLPKIQDFAELTILARALSRLETRLDLPPSAVGIEAMIETPAAVKALTGSVGGKAIIGAAGGRLTGAHFGGYDYASSLDIPASAQSLAHPACQHARRIMQLAFAGTGVWLSDGATHLLPIHRHRPAAGAQLDEAQIRENRDAILAAWRHSFESNMRSFDEGYYQGWDLHPAQLPVRYAACYWGFRKELPAASARMKGFMASGTRTAANMSFFDDAASAGGLYKFFKRGFECGAISAEELAVAGLEADDIK